MKLDGGELGLLEDLVERVCSLLVPHEDDDLVELQLVKEVHQLGDLFTVVEEHVVLFETMECQFALVLN